MFSMFIGKRLQFSNLEKVSQRKRLFHHYRVLKRQIRNGRRKWVQMISEEDSSEVRNLLAGNKGMQRLYQTMSLNQIVDNINQRTFTLRKERDRLTARLENLKADYEKALVGWFGKDVLFLLKCVKIFFKTFSFSLLFHY